MIRTTLSLVVALLFATTASQAQQQSNDPLAALLPAAAATQDNAPAPATPSAPVAATPAQKTLLQLHRYLPPRLRQKPYNNLSRRHRKHYLMTPSSMPQPLCLPKQCAHR